ncbi:hypothetical protein FB384_005214 [Prauserella sediminis]|uniref:Uncharacterized protein n=1 Tax=Prauserella sediminis TaxID=577680 RepID=A0A839Y0P9_9PSEU|nr:hypothetical protein [Prauserella sediminis]
MSATRSAAASVETVFAVLADPTTHAAIDGTGWVQEPVDQATLTEVGQIFRMAMYHPTPETVTTRWPTRSTSSIHRARSGG